MADDPGQPVAYRQQRVLAALVPAPGYPFPAGTSLVRGLVSDTAGPLEGAVVSEAGKDLIRAVFGKDAIAEDPFL